MYLDTQVQRLGYKTYKAYLNSTYWKSVKTRFYKSKIVDRDSEGMPCCRFCKRTDKLHIHHIRYTHLGKESLHELVLLCELCHAFTHRLAIDMYISIYKATKLARKEMHKLLKQQAKYYPSVKKLDKITTSKINFGVTIGLRKRNG